MWFFLTDMIATHLATDLESESLRQLSTKLPSFLVESRAANTVKSYTGGYRKWNDWAKRYDVTPLPGNPVTLALYFLSLIQSEQTLAVIENSFYGIKFIHKTLLKDDPTEHLLVKEMLEVAKRKSKSKTNRKLPLTITVVTNIHHALTSGNPLLTNLRTANMILLAFMGFLRFDEVSKIRCSDVSIHPTHLKIFLEASKTDCYREGKWVHIAANDSPTCPVKNLETYLQSAGLDLEIDRDAYIFRAVSTIKNGSKLRSINKPLSYTRTREQILQAIKQIGLDEKLYGTHSLRAGGATFTANAGIPDRLFKKHGRWMSDKSKDIYVQENLDTLLSVTKSMFVSH